MKKNLKPLILSILFVVTAILLSLAFSMHLTRAHSLDEMDVYAAETLPSHLISEEQETYKSALGIPQNAKIIAINMTPLEPIDSQQAALSQLMRVRRLAKNFRSQGSYCGLHELQRTSGTGTLTMNLQTELNCAIHYPDKSDIHLSTSELIPFFNTETQKPAAATHLYQHSETHNGEPEKTTVISAFPLYEKYSFEIWQNHFLRPSTLNSSAELFVPIGLCFVHWEI